jgi:hypothetical protein
MTVQPDRLDRIESYLAIQQLPIRYAIAVDSRDLDAWVETFVPDVDMGRRGSGREALRAWIEPQVRGFYRSVHQICGHRIEFVDADNARGQVYCRAEHEVGDRWIVMAMCYFDTYRRVDGEWFFVRRQERDWYSADVGAAPQSASFDSWHDRESLPPLPHAFGSWVAFWENDENVGDVTRLP